MKYFLLLFAMFFSTPLWADSTFLSGLNFTTVYEKSGNMQFEGIRKKGISVTDFMKKMNDPKATLGEKVALLEAVSSYYEWGEKQKGKFADYKKAFDSDLSKMYGKDVSVSSEKIAPEVRLLIQLFNDYDSSSPNVEVYQMLAKKMPLSLTAQSVAVKAYAYDILYNDKNDYANVQNFKLNYLQPYYDQFEKFTKDVPASVKELSVNEILLYTFNCENRLKCMTDTSSDQKIAGGLNKLSEDVKSNINNGVPISTVYSSDWIKTKKTALQWINLQEKYISKLKATEVQRAEIRYLFYNKLYELMHNIDNLTIQYMESSFAKDLKNSKSKCKLDAVCAAEAYLKRASADLQKQGISDEDLLILKKIKDLYKQKFEENSAGFGILESAVDGEPVYNFSSSFDMLHYTMLYLYANPSKISEMYDME